MLFTNRAHIIVGFVASFASLGTEAALLRFALIFIEAHSLLLNVFLRTTTTDRRSAIWTLL